MRGVFIDRTKTLGHCFNGQLSMLLLKGLIFTKVVIYILVQICF